MRKDRPLDYFLKTRSFTHDEHKDRCNNDGKRKHRVELMVEFIVNKIKQLGYEPVGYEPENLVESNQANRYQADNELIADFRSKASTTWPECSTDKLKIGLCPFALNHNKYKGWGFKNIVGFIIGKVILKNFCQ